MAKKTKKTIKAKPARAVRRAVKREIKRVSKTAAKSRARKVKAPAQIDLIKGVRYSDLDRLCRNIGDTRDEINRVKSEDADLGLKAIKAMRVHDVSAYKHAGITLMLVPGDEKLRVLKDRGDKASSGEGAAEPAGEPDGDGEGGEAGGPVDEGIGTGSAVN